LDGFDDDSLTAFFGFHSISFTGMCCICILPKSCFLWFSMTQRKTF
jgi:hypothetical protein